MTSAVVRYLLVGVINTAVGLGFILLLQRGLGADPYVANALGYAAGMSVSYVLNRRFTFRSSRDHLTGLPAFLAAALASYMVNAGVLAVALAANVPSDFAQVLAVGSYTVTFFLLNRYVVFRYGAA